MTDHSTSSERAPPRPPARRRSPVQPHLIPAAAHGRTLMQLRATATVCTPYAPWSALLSRLRLSVILAMWSLGTSHDGRGFDDALESGGYAVGVVVGAKVDLEARAVGHAEGGQHLTSDPTNLVDDLTVSVEVDLHRVVALVERDADHIPTLHRPERLQTAGQRPRCRRLVLSHHTHRSTLANGRQADRAGWWVRVSAAVASAWLITQSSGVSLVASPTAKVPGCTMVTSKYACKGCAKGAHKAYFRGPAKLQRVHKASFEVHDGHLVLQDRRVAQNGPVAGDHVPLHLHSSSFELVTQPNHRIERDLRRIRHSPAAAHNLHG
jgi:hypothetical protein